jgi:anti-sigma factor RsiW
MPNCSSIDRLATPYVDGELPDADARAIEQHLALCSPCRSRVIAERSVRNLLHQRKPSLLEDCAPVALRSRCAKLATAAEHAPAHSGQRGARQPSTGAVAPSWYARLAPLAAAAALVIIVVGAFGYQLTANSARVMAAELAADHVKCFAMNAVLRTHQAPAAVESAMASGFGWNVELPADAARAGLELVGSRPGLYGEGKVAHIMYRHNGEPVSLFMLPRTQRKDQLVKVFGHEAAIWCVGERTFVLVTREPQADASRMADFIHASLR